MKIAIVIPTYNESKNIKMLVEQVSRVAHSHRLDVRMIIVDDASPDGTQDIVKQLSKKYPVHLLARKGKLGLGTAYLAGFKKAFELKADLIFSMDADLSHNPQYLPTFVGMADRGYDVVLGSRYVKGGGNNWNLSRKIISGGGNLLARVFLGIPANDVTSGYRCYRSNVLRSIGLDSIKSNGYSFLEEILFLCNEKKFKIGEVPIFFKDRTHGESKLRKIEILKFILTLFRLKARQVKRLVSF